MDMDHLAEQFAGILGHAAEQGVEFPPNMPGMARIGGLHVPTANVSMDLSTPRTPKYASMYVNVPDEHGNLYSLHTMPYAEDPDDHFAGIGQHDGRSVPVPSAEAFANMYGNLGPASEFFQAHNADMLDKFHGVRALMGIGPGQAQANYDHIYDLRSGDLTPANMHVQTAWKQWNAARKRPDSEGGQ